jgi:hypothetical protein
MTKCSHTQSKFMGCDCDSIVNECVFNNYCWCDLYLTMPVWVNPTKYSCLDALMFSPTSCPNPALHYTRLQSSMAGRHIPEIHAYRAQQTISISNAWIIWLSYLCIFHPHHISNIVFFQMMQIFNPYIPQWPWYCLKCTSVRAGGMAILTVVHHLDQCDIPSEGPPCSNGYQAVILENQLKSY